MLNFILGNDYIMGYVLSTVLTAAVGWGAVLATKYLGITVDEKRKQDLHSALKSAALALLAKYGSALEPEQVIAAAKLSVPQAMSHFDADGKGRAAITNIATAKIQEAVNEVAVGVAATQGGFRPSQDVRHVSNRT